MKLPTNFSQSFQNFASLVGLIFKCQWVYFSQIKYSLIFHASDNTVIDNRPCPGPGLKIDVGHLGTFVFNLDEGMREDKVLTKLLNNFVRETELEKVNEKAKTGQSRFETIFEQSPLSIQICTAEGHTLLVNPAWKNLWEISEELIENYILKDYNMLEDKNLIEQGVIEYIRRGYAGEVTHIPVIKYNTHNMGLGTTTRSVEGLIYPLKDSDGKVKEIVLIHLDVTEKEKLLEDLRLERNQLALLLKQNEEKERAQTFISKVTTILVSTIDTQDTIFKIAEACVPEFADACIVDILAGDTIQRLVTRHQDLKVQQLLEKLQTQYPPTLDSPQPSARVIRSGKLDLVKVLDKKKIIDRTFDTNHAELIEQIGANSYLSVPLTVRGKITGAINLINTTVREPFCDKDLETGIELARRASIAIENARLFKKSQKAISKRDEFISIASHELKTPITSMKLQLQMAERFINKSDTKSVSPDFVRKITEGSIKQLNRITILVEDMLDISRISSGKLNLDMKKTDLSLLGKEVISRFTPQTNTLHIPLYVSIQPDLYAFCDAFRIEQVISNLMTNAIRYGENKPISFTLNENKNQIEICVNDNGPGISAADQVRIFERFERAIEASKVSGLGLGLYISRQIMEQHGGSLTVKSSPGQGATFTATLPLKRS